MTERNSKLKANPIIRAAKARKDAGIQKLTGYLGEGAAGKVELYLDLDMATCLELNEQDVIHFVEAEKPTEPSVVFVDDKARITVRQNITASALAALSSGSCGCSNPNEVQTGFLARQIGGAGLSDYYDCLFKKLACVLKCPTDPFLRQGCLDSCAAAERLCRGPIFGGGGGIKMF